VIDLNELYETMSIIHILYFLPTKYILSLKSFLAKENRCIICSHLKGESEFLFKILYQTKGILGPAGRQRQ